MMGLINMIDEFCITKGMIEQCESWIEKALEEDDRYSQDFVFLLLGRLYALEEHLNTIGE